MNPINEILFKFASGILLVMYTGIRWYFQKGQKEFQPITVKHERREVTAQV